MCFIYFHNCTHFIFKAFSSHEVVPDVVDKAPHKKIKIKYMKSDKEAKLGNELKPADVREMPYIHYDGDADDFYTIIMTDPDAPSRKQPSRREFQHWTVVNIPGEDVNKGETLADYVGSGPPKDTGLHRYVFLLYKQPNKLSFNEPHRNNTHASTRAKFSVKQFAEKYKLGNPVAGNFFQAQFDESVPALHKQFTS